MTTIEGMPVQQERAAQGRDPRGWLVFDGLLPEPYAGAEDSTAVCDRDYARQRNPRPYTRPATSTEVALLQHLGYDTPDDLETTVSWPSKSCRRRRWLALETPDSYQ
jgi:hypothetical protein